MPNNEQLRLLVKHEEIKLSEIDTSEVTDMSFLFHQRYKFERQDFSGIDEWDTSKVETFVGMFRRCREFNKDISGWDTSSAKSFSGMFSGALRFNQPIGKWNTSNVTDMSDMFRAPNTFNQPLNEWDTSSVTNMSGMFSGARQFNQPIGKWNTSNVTDMSSMFRNADAFNQPLNEWDTSKVTNMKGMFHWATKFNQDINDWNVSRVTDFSYMFASGFVANIFGEFNQPLNKWDVSNAENMNSMFKNVRKFEQDLSAWGDKLGKLQDMREMFSGVGKDDSVPQNSRSLKKPVLRKPALKKPFYGIGKEALEKIKFLKTWYVRDFCKVIDAECKLDDKEIEKIVETLEDERVNLISNLENKILYEKLTNPQYIAQMRMLEKALKTPKTRVGTFDSSIGISILESLPTNENIKEFKEFLDDRKWIPENIKEKFKAFLPTKDGIKTWDKAYCEVFEQCFFKIERYKQENDDDEKEKENDEKEKENDEKEKDEKNEESRESVSGDFHLIQGYKIEDFRDFGVIRESEFEEIDEDTSLCFTPRDIYIWHKSKDENDKQGQNNRVFDIVLNVIIAQAYYRKMIGFRDRARKSDENTRKETKELQKCHRDVCKFDLKAYNSLPMETNVNDYKFLRAIWKKISDTYSVDETYKELKESIAQMSQLLTDYKRDRQSWWFSLAAVLIALVSLLVAVVSALPVVEKLLE